MSIELAGVLASAFIAWIGWIVRRDHQRRTLAVILRMDAKLRNQWEDAIKRGQELPETTMLPTWRSLQGEVADLFPLFVTANFSGAWELMAMDKKTLSGGQGFIDSVCVNLAAVEFALAWYMNEKPSPHYSDDLASWINDKGATRLRWTPPVRHRVLRASRNSLASLADCLSRFRGQAATSFKRALRRVRKTLKKRRLL